jgi:transcriptional regulator with XRE-family HTH domain
MVRPPRRGKQYSHETIRHSMRLKSNNLRNLMTQQQIADRVGVRTQSTISRYFHADMREKAVKSRRLRKGWNRKISLREKYIFSGWTYHQISQNAHVTGKKSISFIREAFQQAVSKGWVSRTMKGLGYSSHRVRRINKLRRAPVFVRNMKTFLLDLRKYIKRPNQILAFDQTNVNADAVVRRSYAEIGR